MYVYYKFRTDWIKKDGNCYKLKAGVIVDVQDDLPIIGQIEDIYVVDGSTIILMYCNFGQSMNSIIWKAVVIMQLFH